MKLTAAMIDRIMELCVGEMSEDDLVTLQGKLEEMLSDKEMAADAALKRRVMFALDYQARGRDVIRRRDAARSMAEDVAGLEQHFPNINRLDRSGGLVASVPDTRRRAAGRVLSASERAEASSIFPNMFREH